jgi:hypothetical protein
MKFKTIENYSVWDMARCSFGFAVRFYTFSDNYNDVTEIANIKMARHSLI